MRAQVFSDFVALVDGNTTGTHLQPSRAVPIREQGRHFSQYLLLSVFLLAHLRASKRLGCLGVVKNNCSSLQHLTKWTFAIFTAC